MENALKRLIENTDKAAEFKAAIKSAAKKQGKKPFAKMQTISG